MTYKQMNGSFSQSSPSSMAAIHGWDKDQIHRPRSTSDITELHQSDTRRSRLNSPSTQLLLQPPLAQSTSSTNNVDTVDFYDVGNVLGEIGILEKAVSKIDAECETDAQLYFIEREKLEKLMKEQTVLEERMWKILAVHISSTLLIQTPEYQVCVRLSCTVYVHTHHVVGVLHHGQRWRNMSQPGGGGAKIKWATWDCG